MLADLSAAAARRLLIGRLGGLTVLNGGEIKGRSRDDAERFYLRQALQARPEGPNPNPTPIPTPTATPTPTPTVPPTLPLLLPLHLGHP